MLHGTACVVTKRVDADIQCTHICTASCVTQPPKPPLGEAFRYLVVDVENVGALNELSEVAGGKYPQVTPAELTKPGLP